MKKMLFVLVMLLTTIPAKADIITSTLLDHVTTVTQFQNGKTKYALMDSVIQIGKINRKSFLDLQAGINGDTKPNPNEVNGASFLAGAWLKVNPFLENVATFPGEWQFLRSLEHGPALSYDFRDRIWVGSYQIGLAFGLSPK